MTNQFPKGAKKPINPSTQGDGMSKLAEMFKGKPAPHEPIIKSLEKIGVNAKVMILPIGDEPVDCIVIPVDELMFKEYKYMSGIDVQAIHEKANASVEPQREEQEGDGIGETR